MPNFTNMDAAKIVKKLQQKYPNKTIIKYPKTNPTEILCEIEPTTDHPNYSLAVAVVDQSLPHYHKLSTEAYEVIKGTLLVIKNGKRFTLQEGDTIIIEPNTIHFVKGTETWLYVRSKPGWTLVDHILIN